MRVKGFAFDKPTFFDRRLLSKNFQPVLPMASYPRVLHQCNSPSANVMYQYSMELALNVTYLSFKLSLTSEIPILFYIGAAHQYYGFALRGVILLQKSLM